eukprot:6827498-Ditylum_brightwellii.AAC.1
MEGQLEFETILIRPKHAPFDMYEGESKKSAQFMCPALDIFIDEHKLFGSMKAYKGKNKHLIYYHTGNPCICQNDMPQADAKPYYAPANVANDGTFIGASGLTGYGFTHDVSDAEINSPLPPFYVLAMKKDL